jgi:hypothetical protein
MIVYRIVNDWLSQPEKSEKCAKIEKHGDFEPLSSKMLIYPEKNEKCTKPEKSIFSSF